MQFSSQLLFFFSALGAFNGILLSLYFFFGKSDQSGSQTTERKWLGALLFAISLRISKSVWLYFDPSINKPFLQLGLSACFLIGPLLFFYVASVVKRIDSLAIPWKLHLAVLLFITILVGIIWPYQSNPELWRHYFYLAINITWGAYILAAAWLLLPKAIVLVGDNSRVNAAEALCIKVGLGTFIIWLAYFTASYTSYIVGALSFSFVLYVSVLIWLMEGPHKKAKPYADKKIDKALEQALSKQLNALMTEQKLYQNANLTLPVLAKKLGVSVPQLSQLLNDNLKVSFAHYVNGLRIEEAKRLLVSESNLTMELVAERSGYNSQSTFYTAFKQFEQTTPAKYRKAHSEL